MAESTVPTKVERKMPATREEGRYLIPPVDIFETSQGLTVVADLPGVSKDGLDVRVEDDTLTILAHVGALSVGQPIRSEYELRDFYRQFRLGEEVDQERISAEFKNGVLTLQLPKAAKAQPKQISVNFG